VIRDAKGGLPTRALDWYVRRKVQAAFRGLWVRGTLPPSEAGLVVYLNHSSFWDGFIAHQLGQLAGWDAYAMMEEANLARYRFHTRIGAFSVRRGDARSALETLRHGRKLLARPRAAVMVFPEGELQAGQGPLLPLSRGVEVLARTAGVPCLPVAVRYAFLEHEHPDVLLEVGQPHPPGPLAHFQAGLEEVYARVMGVRSLEGFRLALPGRRGVQERWDRFRGLRRPPSTSSGAPAPPGQLA
jgi:1-acyl-sn-glycerol-3-phosphate acyltransferase